MMMEILNLQILDSANRLITETKQKVSVAVQPTCLLKCFHKREWVKKAISME